MSDSIREIPMTTVGPRVETGPTRIGDDHCGLFIRGNDCFRYALCLESILSKREDRVPKLDILDVITLQGLLNLVQSTNENFVRSVEQVRQKENERVPGLEKMTVEQIKNSIKDRQDLMSEMVGTLYPSIVADEITVLKKRLTELLIQDAYSSS